MELKLLRDFELHIATEPAEGVAKFRLSDRHGTHLAASQIKLVDHPPSLWEGLFDTRRYVKRYAGNLLLPGQTQPATAEALLEQLAVFLNQQVLGPGITEKLGGIHHRALLVQLPEGEHDPLAAAFARVPWEIACPRPGEPSLMRQNLVVRVGLSGMPAASDDEALEDLRVLLVFAEAPGSRPLAMRQEREALLELFYEQVLPERRVEVDVLCHGVTEARLRETVRDRKGYHLIHWSGHGHYNLLELYGEEGKPAHLTGDGLVQLLVDAGGFIPRLVFLSACLSGTFVKARDWATFEAAMAGRKREEQTKEAKLPEILAVQPGYTGTALALLRAGVPQVVAMRYEVGDDYARALALGFYKHLLADRNLFPAESALALARSELLRNADRTSGFQAIDHATALIFGHTQPRFRPKAARSVQLRFVRPQPQPLLAGSRELNPPARFVGRGAELTRLADEWLPRHKPAIALVQGLAGLGKTAIAAEAIHLWHPRFDWVLAFQAKPMALALEEFYRRLDARLTLESTTLREKCENSRNVRIYLEPGKPLSGAARYERMRNNLVEALRDERILLILDNFETNLESINGHTGYACQDPEWDRLLVELAERLPETGSRVLITSRHRLVALATDKTVWILLGPLPIGETGLYIRSHPELRKLYYADEAGRVLVLRLIEVSRGHPLILDYLSRLVPDRHALSQALDRLQSKGLQTLPDLFVPIKSDSDREREWTYLEDAMISSVDYLIRRVSSQDVRRLLWIVTLSSEPVREDIVASVWSGGPLWLRAKGKMWVLILPADADQTPEGASKKLEGMPPDVRKHFAEKLDHISANTPVVGRLLDELCDSGLLNRECGQNETPILTFHELVRERIAAWVEQHPEERAGRTQEQAWVAYGERYALAYLKWAVLRATSQDNAMELGMEAGRRALIYLTRAHAFEHLFQFASSVVTSTHNPASLNQVVDQLKGVIDGMPADNIYSCYVRGYLADSLRSTGQFEQALPLYEQAAEEAQTAKQWAQTGLICANWGTALVEVGQLEVAKGTLLRAIQAYRKSGWDHLDLVGMELEALHVDVMQGKAERGYCRKSSSA